MAGSGLPLLSGLPLTNMTGHPETACRKCNKEFNLIFTRSRMCYHCGYSFCYNCSDYQALMPRGPDQGPGYDPTNVCAYCIEMLQITAATEGSLKRMPLSKLKKYAAAYNISLDTLVEKEEIVRALVIARRPNGCLSANHENFYRRYSVPIRNEPIRGIFSRGPAPPPPPPRPQTQPLPNFARPDLTPDHPPPVPPRDRPAPPPQASRPYSRPASTPPTPPRTSRPMPQPFPRPRATSARPPPPPSPASRPVTAPPLDRLISMSSQDIASLSISVLKAILLDNHVHVGSVLEKEELVRKVATLAEVEKQERERHRLAEEAEEAERIARQRDMLEEREREIRRREQAQAQAQAEEASRSTQDQDKAQSTASPPAPSSSSPPPPPQFAPAMNVERTGLCVVCQDEEANIAIVDCGHLAICRGCSVLIMSSTRECPLCRTHIVSEARMLRIFKT